MSGCPKGDKGTQVLKNKKPPFFLIKRGKCQRDMNSIFQDMEYQCGEIRGEDPVLMDH